MLTGVINLAAGEAFVVDTSGSERFSIIAGAGATVTYSRVDSKDADAHTTGTENQDTVAATTIETIDTDWPFYRVSVAGGSCRIAAV